MFELCSTANRLRSDININTSARMVLSILCDCANNKSECWPSNISVAERAGLSERSVYRAVVSLKKGGYIEVIHRRNSGNTYKINTDILRAGSVLIDKYDPLIDKYDRLTDTVSHEAVIKAVNKAIKIRRPKMAKKKTGLDGIALDLKKGNPIGGLKPSKNISLPFAWRKSVIKWRGENGYNPDTELSISSVASSQLKVIAKRCGTLRPDIFVNTLISKWGTYCSYVKDAEGEKHVPATPSISFILKYINAANDFIEINQNRKKPKSKPKLGKIKKPKIKKSETVALLEAIESGKL